jgi:hypothetical protein
MPSAESEKIVSFEVGPSRDNLPMVTGRIA